MICGIGDGGAEGGGSSVICVTNMGRGGMKEGLKFGSGMTGRMGMGSNGLFLSSGWQHIGQYVEDQCFMMGRYGLQY